MNKLVLVIAVSVALIIAGIVLSVGANYGLIKESNVFAKPFNFDVYGWNTTENIAEWVAIPGQTVTVQLTDYAMSGSINRNDEFAVRAENAYWTITTEQFNFDYAHGQKWSPNVYENPIYLFTTQSPGTYTIWASASNPSDFSWGHVTLSLVVTNPPPYTLMVILGLVMLAIGVIAMVLGLFFMRQTSGRNTQSSQGPLHPTPHQPSNT
jgi:uncharacterized secreted protein with C-terminal beta-propeller domain